jgi:hypothetical protein
MTPLRHLPGNHTITKANAHEYADVGSIGGNATIRAKCLALKSIGGYAGIYALCPALTTIGGHADIWAECPSLKSIQGKTVAPTPEFRALVAKRILSDLEHLKMETFYSPCGTSYCLAGWAQYLAGPEWSEDAGIKPATAGACLLGVEFAPLFYKTRPDQREEVLTVIRGWV